MPSGRSQVGGQHGGRGGGRRAESPRSPSGHFAARGRASHESRRCTRLRGGGIEGRGAQRPATSPVSSSSPCHVPAWGALGAKEARGCRTAGRVRRLLPSWLPKFCTVNRTAFVNVLVSLIRACFCVTTPSVTICRTFSSPQRLLHVQAAFMCLCGVRRGHWP